MKKIVSVMIVLCMIFMSVNALAATDSSFAIVNKDQVNLREKPGGNRIVYLNEGENVFVLETKKYQNRPWHRVMVAYDQGRRYRQGWVDAAFLTDVRDAYEGVVQAAVGDRHVLLRFADGSVDAFGFDFRGNMAVEGFGKVEDIAAARFQCCGLVNGNLIYANPIYWEEVQQQGNLKKLISNVGGGDDILAIDREGKLVLPLGMMEEDDWFLHPADVIPQGEKAKDAVFGMYHVVVLTESGTVYVAVRYPEMPEQAALLQADGLKNVKKLSCGYYTLCALMEDGSVQVFSNGLDEEILQEIASWKNVRDVTAIDGFVAAAMEDGSVRVAGKMVSADVNISHFSQDLFRNPQKEGLMDHWENIVSLVGGHKILVGIRSDGGIEAISLQRYE